MYNKPSQSGFTLIETLVAILILSISISALLTLAASGFFSVRYARNQIVADALVQEGIEYIRNSRDTAYLTGEIVHDNGSGARDWSAWLTRLNVNGSGNSAPYTGTNNRGCFTTNGCIVDPYTQNGKNFIACGSTCPYISYFPPNTSGTGFSFYGYVGQSYPYLSSVTPVTTTYRRTVTVVPKVISGATEQIIVTVKVDWMNGNTNRSASQSVVLSNWK
jgi:prepilin-type N-terminal cleavage/methylation domain-containing protein